LLDVIVVLQFPFFVGQTEDVFISCIVVWAICRWKWYSIEKSSLWRLIWYKMSKCFWHFYSYS